MARTLKDLTIGVSPATGNIYIGYVSKNDPNLFTSKIEVTDKVINAVKDHLIWNAREDDKFGGFSWSDGSMRWEPAEGEVKDSETVE